MLFVMCMEVLAAQTSLLVLTIASSSETTIALRGSTQAPPSLIPGLTAILRFQDMFRNLLLIYYPQHC